MSQITAIDASSTATGAATSGQRSESSGEDRFLKLLVAQMKNQDPLNPLDNAEVTSQMAQISTVSGIEKLNKSLAEMSGSFSAMQALQSASLVGRQVLIEGDSLPLNANGAGGGGLNLEAAAQSVRVNVLASDGSVLDTLDLGSLPAGRHLFDWQAPRGLNTARVAGFEVVATNAGQAVSSTALMRDSVRAVSASDGRITLELAGRGNTPLSQVLSYL
jgi:flagellar basal-body rod modification protein FlgD